MWGKLDDSEDKWAKQHIGWVCVVSVIFYKMVNNIGRQVRSASDDTDLSDKWKKIFHVKAFIKSSVKGKDCKLS